MSSSQIGEQVTARILALLEQGNLKWLRGWSAVDAPYNAQSGRRYTGGNTLILRLAQAALGTLDPRWFTWNQIKELDAANYKKTGQTFQIHVSKNQPATIVMFYRTVPKKDEEEGSYRLMRTYTVWNGCQITGVPPYEPVHAEPASLARLDALVWNYGIHISQGGDQAYYLPGADSIQLPLKASFKSEQAYYGTLLHEVGHSTGHATRLNRDLSGGFGSPKYAREELTAELISAIGEQTWGVPAPDIQNAAAYIKHWLKALNDDKTIVLGAAAAAQAAVDYLSQYDPEAADKAELEAAEAA